MWPTITLDVFHLHQVANAGPRVVGGTGAEQVVQAAEAHEAAAAVMHVVRVQCKVPGVAADAERAQIAVTGHHHRDESVTLVPGEVRAGDPRPVGERNMGRAVPRAPEPAASTTTTAEAEAERHLSVSAMNRLRYDGIRRWPTRVARDRQTLARCIRRCRTPAMYI